MTNTPEKIEVKKKQSLFVFVVANPNQSKVMFWAESMKDAYYFAAQEAERLHGPQAVVLTAIIPEDNFRSLAAVIGLQKKPRIIMCDHEDIGDVRKTQQLAKLSLLLRDQVAENEGERSMLARMAYRLDDKVARQLKVEDF